MSIKKRGSVYIYTHVPFLNKNLIHRSRDRSMDPIRELLGKMVKSIFDGLINVA